MMNQFLCFGRFLLPLLSVLVLFSQALASAATPTPTPAPTPLFQGSWIGAAGPSNSLSTSGTFLLDSWQSVVGTLKIAFTKPAKTTPFGSYSATLSLFDGFATWAFKGKGAISGTNTIESSWTASAKGAPGCQVNLALSGSNQLCLTGTALLSGTHGISSYPLFAMPLSFNAKSNPLTDSGSYTLFLTDHSGVAGTATGSASMTTAGAVRIAGTFTNGKKFSASSTVLSYGGQQFFTLFFSPTRTTAFGAWALKDSLQTDSDWAGPALLGTSSLDLALARFTKPLIHTPIVAWTSPATLFLAHPDFLAAEGLVSLSSANKLVVNFDSGFGLVGSPFTSFSLSLNSANGMVTGSAKYPNSNPPPRPDLFLPPISATITGALNQKNGTILGCILPKTANASSGVFDITPEQ